MTNARRAERLIFTGVREAQVKTVDVAAPAAGQLRLITLACGICWREIHVFTGSLERKFPVIMGHEPVGIVDEVGPGVVGFKVGDRVTAIGEASLAEYCLRIPNSTTPASLPAMSCLLNCWQALPSHQLIHRYLTGPLQTVSELGRFTLARQQADIGAFKTPTLVRKAIHYFLQNPHPT